MKLTTYESLIVANGAKFEIAKVERKKNNIRFKFSNFPPKW